MNTTDTTLMRQIRQGLLELELVSHGRTASWGDKTSPDASDSIGGRKPSGSNVEYPRQDLTTDERRSFESSYLSKTVEHYRRKLEGRFDRHTGEHRPGLLDDPQLSDQERASQLEALLKDIRETVTCWRFTPPPQRAGVDPERGTFYWKCMVADDDRGTLKQIHQRHQISRMTLWRYRQRYRGILTERTVRM